ncbi:MAG TPA: hypothetical protein VE398_00320 [Acidobacteriota bacterium]|nr:hypothetical protein [Acidobacteriota bacterium]
MTINKRVSGDGNGVSRRTVLTMMGSVPLAGGALLGKGGATARQSARGSTESPEVRVAYLRPREKYWLGWPGTSWDPDGFMQKSRAMIEQYAREYELRVTFEPQPLYDAAATEQFVARLNADKPDAVLAIPLHMERWPMVEAIAKGGIPTVIFAGLGTAFTGHIQKISRMPGVYLASTADFDLKAVHFGLKMVQTAQKVRNTRIAVLAGTETREQILEPFGLKLLYLPRRRFPETLKSVEGTPQVQAIALEYRDAAQKIVEPSQQDLINAAKNYVASLRIMEEEDCQGITMDCLGLVKDRQIPCPPCMAWSRLLDAGTPAICEADINAVMSHTLCCRLLDKPGFQQDPVPETVNNTFIGAHCVSPTRLDGYDKPRAPFILRSHAESNLGVSLQVLWEPGRTVTIMQFVGAGKMILGKGKVLRNFDTPPAGGCRTSVELEIDGPADTRDTKGFHQLFIYGDHVRDFQAYGQMYGIATEHI